MGGVIEIGLGNDKQWQRISHRNDLLAFPVSARGHHAFCEFVPFRILGVVFHENPSEYASTYDTVVLEVEEIKEDTSGSVRDIAESDSAPGPNMSSNIKVADLLDLVKGNAKKYIPKPAEKLSDRDTEGNELSTEQQEFFKDSKMRDEQGNLIPMYHGTDTPNFTVFNPEYSDDGISLFFTSNPEVANTYTSLQDQGRDIDPYNLITADSSAEQFNAAQEKAGGGLRVVKITPEWIQQMKTEAEKKATKLFGIANKYADLLAYNNSSKIFNYDIERIKNVTDKGAESLKADDVNALRRAMGSAEQHSFLATDHKGAAREISRLYHSTYSRREAGTVRFPSFFPGI